MNYVLGVDEVGRGALAGPCLAAAVLLDVDWPGWEQWVAENHVKDSKALSPGRREKAYRAILGNPHLISMGVGVVSAAGINEMGIDWANKSVLYDACIDALRFSSLAALGVRPVLWIDGTMRLSPMHEQELRNRGVKEINYKPKADAEIPAVAAASILAKVLRDRHMEELARDYPGYDFENSAGYHCKAHRTALQTLGPTPEHRTVFIQKIMLEVENGRS